MLGQIWCSSLAQMTQLFFHEVHQAMELAQFPVLQQLWLLHIVPREKTGNHSLLERLPTQQAAVKEEQYAIGALPGINVAG